MVLAKLGGEEYCPTFCHADIERIVDAGAERIGIVLGETATAHDWASLIDHTLLKPEATEADIQKLCRRPPSLALLPFASIRAGSNGRSEFLEGTGVPVCTVIGFPLGSDAAGRKGVTRRGVRSLTGPARSIWSSISASSNRATTVRSRTIFEAVVDAAHENHILCKVIIETAFLTDEEKVRACLAAKECRCGFCKNFDRFCQRRSDRPRRRLDAARSATPWA